MSWFRLFGWKIVKTKYGYGILYKTQYDYEYKTKVFTKRDREHYYGLGK